MKVVFTKTELMILVTVVAAAGVLSIESSSAAGGGAGGVGGGNAYYGEGYRSYPQQQQPQQQQQQWYNPIAYDQERYYQQQQQQPQRDPQQSISSPSQFESVPKQEEDVGPPPLPPGWSEYFDPNTGRPYYYNQADGTTTWNRPPPPTSTNQTQAAVEEDSPISSQALDGNNNNDNIYNGILEDESVVDALEMQEHDSEQRIEPAQGAPLSRTHHLEDEEGRVVSPEQRQDIELQSGLYQHQQHDSVHYQHHPEESQETDGDQPREQLDSPATVGQETFSQQQQHLQERFQSDQVTTDGRYEPHIPQQQQHQQPAGWGLGGTSNRQEPHPREVQPWGVTTPSPSDDQPHNNNHGSVESHIPQKQSESQQPPQQWAQREQQQQQQQQHSSTTLSRLPLDRHAAELTGSVSMPPERSDAGSTSLTLGGPQVPQRQQQQVMPKQSGWFRQAVDPRQEQQQQQQQQPVQMRQHNQQTTLQSQGPTSQGLPWQQLQQQQPHARLPQQQQQQQQQQGYYREQPHPQPQQPQLGVNRELPQQQQPQDDNLRSQQSQLSQQDPRRRFQQQEREPVPSNQQRQFDSASAQEMRRPLPDQQYNLRQPQYPQQRQFGQQPSDQRQRPISQYGPYGNPGSYNPYTGQPLQQQQQQQGYATSQSPQQYQQQQQERQLISTQDVAADAVRGALGNAWQSLLGFRNRTREAVGQATDTMVSSAAAAGQSISATSTSLWGQAKTALGSVFESGEPKGPGPRPTYSLSGQNYGPAPGRGPQGYPQQQQQQQQQGYPPQQQGYPPYGGYPQGYGPPQPRTFPAYPHQGQQQQQVSPQLQSQWGGYTPRTFGQQPQQPQGSVPSRQQNYPGQPNKGGQQPLPQQYQPPQNRPPQQQQQQTQGKDPWSHPGSCPQRPNKSKQQHESSIIIVHLEEYGAIGPLLASTYSCSSR